PVRMQAEFPYFEPPLGADFISEETELQLVADLKIKIASEKNIEMPHEILSSLPEKLLILILANLLTL
ncbi:hypothetical protein KI387_041091, partial [Taxus chinensis]